MSEHDDEREARGGDAHGETREQRWDAWDAQAPPPDFAEKVARTAEDADRRARRRGRIAAGATVLALAAAAALVARRGARADHGEITADARIEAAIDGRATVVLEPGARIVWTGSDVTQSAGDVFYRVEKRGPFRVRTPAGVVDVQGTCFRVKVRGVNEMNGRDVKSGAIGAALSAAAFVAVYEGKVAVSRGDDRVELRAGEAARATGDGVRRASDVGGAERAVDAQNGGSAAGDEPLAQANANLADQVREYKGRLDAIAAEKSEVEKQLRRAQEKLAAEADGSAGPAKSDFDLSQDDWKELAKTGTVRYQLPCCRAGWQPNASDLQRMRISPQEAPAVAAAQARSSARTWSQIKPLCAQALGGSVDVAEKIGASTCVHLIIDTARDKDNAAVNEAFRQVSEIRAGLRPMPAPGDAVSPVERVFLATTGELPQFEADLAQTFGPDDAHRIAFTDYPCTCSNNFGGPGPREK